VSGFIVLTIYYIFTSFCKHIGPIYKSFVLNVSTRTITAQLKVKVLKVLSYFCSALNHRQADVIFVADNFIQASD